MRASELLTAAVKASRPRDSKFAMVQLPLAPNVDAYFLPADATDTTAPVASLAPLLTGFNSDEYGLFGAPSNEAEFVEMVRERYGSHVDRATGPSGTAALRTLPSARWVDGASSRNRFGKPEMPRRRWGRVG